MLGQPEINNPQPGGILLVGRDWGEHEERLGLPFQGPAGDILDQCLAEAGIRREDVNITNVVNARPRGNNFRAHSRTDLYRGLEELSALVERLEPNVICALGNEATFACAFDWPTRNGDILGSYGIQDRRGYIYEGKLGSKVVATIHPASILHGQSKADEKGHGTFGWVPWRILLRMDIERAKEESHEPDIKRPVRDVTIVSTKRGAERAKSHLDNCERLACDIELTGDQGLACVGFAGVVGQAYVYVGQALPDAFSILRGGQVPLVFANGQFDLHYLWTRCGVRTVGFADDTQLAWHACYPELAGKSEHKSYRMTRKSLAFLGSIFVKDEWWKDYDFQTEEERYVLNGRDCCITLDIMDQLDEKIDGLAVRDIYNHSLSLVWPCVDMQSRGLCVDEDLRERRIDQLTDRIESLRDRLTPIVEPILLQHKDELVDVWHLFEKTWTCPCCRNGKSKREACWSCAGYEKKPGKRRLAEDEKILALCQECSGEGQRLRLEFNPRSSEQKVALLYHALKLPGKYSDGKLAVDEEKVKSLLVGLA